MKNLTIAMIVLAAHVSTVSIDAKACEQKLVKEDNKISIKYVPEGCEYDSWNGMDVKVEVDKVGKAETTEQKLSTLITEWKDGIDEL